MFAFICTGYRAKCIHHQLGQSGSLKLIAKIKDIKHMKKPDLFHLVVGWQRCCSLITPLPYSERTLGEMHVSRQFWDGNSELPSKIPVVIFADSVGQVFTVLQNSDQKTRSEPCLTSNQLPTAWEPWAPGAVGMEMTFAASKGGSAPSTVASSDIRAMTIVSWKGNSTLEYFIVVKYQ